MAKKSRQTEVKQASAQTLVKGAVALGLAAILAAGVCCLGFASRNAEGKWFKNFGNISGWHWSDESTSDIGNDGDQNAGGAIIGDGESKGIKLMSQLISPDDYASYDIEPQSDSAYTLTATLDSDDPDLSVLDWSIAFTNASSTWASGKSVSDYVTMSVASDTHSATLACAGAFGEQIKITVKSVYNTEATASCTVDYVKRVTAINVSHTSAGQEGKFKLCNDNILTVTPTYGVGTVGGNLLGGGGFNVTKRYLVASGYVSSSIDASSKGYVILDQTEVPSGTHQVTPAMFITGGAVGTANYKLVYNSLVSSMQHSGAWYHWKVDFTVTYGGKVYQTATMEDSDTFHVDTSAVTMYGEVNNITIPSSVIF